MAIFQQVGSILKTHRQAAAESLKDVSDAVEIDPVQLSKMEQGQLLPPEDILELLISHFNLDDHQAIELWSLAGYTKAVSLEDFMPSNDESNEPKQINVNIPADQHILYSDMVHVISNKYGVVMNFVQGVGPNGQPTVVSRIGMSRDHAKSVLEVLKKSLEKDQN